MRYNPYSLPSTGETAKKVAAQNGCQCYIVPTAYGWRIVLDRPPKWQKHIIVEPNGQHYDSD